MKCADSALHQRVSSMSVSDCPRPMFWSSAAQARGACRRPRLSQFFVDFSVEVRFQEQASGAGDSAREGLLLGGTTNRLLCDSARVVHQQDSPGLMVQSAVRLINAPSLNAPTPSFFPTTTSSFDFHGHFVLLPGLGRTLMLFVSRGPISGTKKETATQVVEAARREALRQSYWSASPPRSISASVRIPF